VVRWFAENLVLVVIVFGVCVVAGAIGAVGLARMLGWGQRKPAAGVA
jgi:hypothetical protein